MDRRTFLSTAAVGASALSGCQSVLPWSNEETTTPLPDTPSGSWTQYGADGTKMSATDVSAPARGNLAWTSDAFTQWQPVVSDGTVYMTNFAPSRDGSVFALDAQDGTELWQTTLDAEGKNGTALVDGRLLVAYGTDLVALNPDNGEEVWTRTTRGLLLPEALAADESTGTVLVGSRAGIEVFRAEDGEKRWETDTVRGVTLAPAVSDGEVFAVGTANGTLSLVSFSLDDGSERWRRELTAAPESTRPIATQHGVVVSDGGSLVVHDRDSGERTREIDPFEYEDNSPRTVAVDDGTAFVTGSAGGIFAVDLETGTERWHRAAPLPDLGICVGTETVVLPFDNPDFSSGATTISALDRESGETRWYYGFDLADDPNGLRVRALVDGAVFFTADGELGVLGDVAE